MTLKEKMVRIGKGTGRYVDIAYYPDEDQFSTVINGNGHDFDIADVADVDYVIDFSVRNLKLQRLLKEPLTDDELERAVDHLPYPEKPFTLQNVMDYGCLPDMYSSEEVEKSLDESTRFIRLDTSYLGYNTPKWMILPNELRRAV